MIGTILKGYQILDKIKDGSVGTVWRAKNNRNQVVALKQLSKRNSGLRRKLKQFRREATLTKKLNHRHIIKVYEYVSVKPQPFFTMEYFESENLKYSMWHMQDRVYKNEFYILRQVAEALAYIHSLGIIHKDIKPENILVSSNSEIRVIDFSLAQTKMDRMMQFGRRIEGTPLYMAPEQIRGEKCDTRTDIYAFGVMMYELLTKHPPFIGTTERKILEKHVKDPPTPMKNHVKTISGDLEAFVQKMLAKKPTSRYQDMTSVIYELSKWEKKDTVVRMRQVEPGSKAEVDQ